MSLHLLITPAGAPHTGQGLLLTSKQTFHTQIDACTNTHTHQHTQIHIHTHTQPFTLRRNMTLEVSRLPFTCHACAELFQLVIGRLLCVA